MNGVRFDSRPQRCTKTGDIKISRMVKILERVNGQSPMMDSGYGGQEELASVAGLRDGFINQELLLRNEYLAAENHILKSQIKGRLRLSEGERATLAGICQASGA